MVNRRTLRLMAVLVTGLCAAILSGCGGDDPLDAYRKDGVPIVGKLSPDGGLVGTVVSITGELFGNEQGEGTVTIFAGEGGAPIDATIDMWSDKEIQFRIPPSQVQDARVVVKVTNHDGKTCPYDVYMTIFSGSIQQ